MLTSALSSAVLETFSVELRPVDNESESFSTPVIPFVRLRSLLLRNYSTDGTWDPSPARFFTELFQATQNTLTRLDVDVHTCHGLAPLPTLPAVLARLAHLTLDLRTTNSAPLPLAFLSDCPSLESISIHLPFSSDTSSNIISLVEALPLPSTLRRFGLSLSGNSIRALLVPVLNTLIALPQLQNIVSFHFLQQLSHQGILSRIDAAAAFLEVCEEREVAVVYGA